MIAVRLSKEIEKKLEQLATNTNRTKSFYIRKAIEDFLEDSADYLLAVERLAKKNTRIPLEEVMKRYGLED